MTTMLAAPPASPPNRTNLTARDLPEPDPERSWRLVLIAADGTTTPEFLMMIDPVVAASIPGNFKLRLYLDSRESSVEEAFKRTLGSRAFRAVEIVGDGSDQWRCYEVSYADGVKNRERYPEVFASQVLNHIKGENIAPCADECEVPEFVADDTPQFRVYDPVENKSEVSPKAASIVRTGYFVTKLTSRAGPLRDEERVSVEAAIAKNVARQLAEGIGALSREEFSVRKPSWEQILGNLEVVVAPFVRKRASFPDVQRAFVEALSYYREFFGLSAEGMAAVLKGPSIENARAVYTKNVR